MKRYIYYGVVVVLLLLLAITSTLAVVFLIQNNEKQDEINRLQDEINELRSAKPDAGMGFGGNIGRRQFPPTEQCTGESADGAIKVESPCKFSLVDSPLNIKGTATGLFEGNMIVEIYDENDVLLHKEILTLSGSDNGDPVDFDETLEWSTPTQTATGRVKFYAQSAKDGSEISIVNIPVRFK